jgi:anti-sigma factor RsiW
MRCRELEPLVVPFVDGEIAEADRAHVDDHLKACPPCRSRIDAERAAREVVIAARDRLRDTAPRALRERCAGLCAARRHARRWVPLTLAAAASLFAALIWFGGTDAGTPVLAAQLTLDHVKCSKFNSRRVSGSPLQLATYWREQYGWPIRVPADFDADVHLSGVRRCGSSDGSTAHIMYTHHGRPLSLFIARAGGRTPRVLGMLGHEAVVWSSDDRTYVLVGNEARADMETLAALIRKDLPIR